MKSKVLIFVCAIVVCLTLLDLCAARVHSRKALREKIDNRLRTNEKQFFDIETRETNPPNFIRLLVMRLVYGIATQMGMEERLSNVLGGAFVPPNAEDDFGGFDDFDGGDIFDE